MPLGQRSKQSICGLRWKARNRIVCRTKTDLALKSKGSEGDVEVCVLASGSSGNCIYVGGTSMGILIDAGISCKVTTERLLAAGIDPLRIAAVCVTHEHEDHKGSLAVLHRRMGLQLFANTGTIEALERSPKTAGLPWQIFSTGHPFEVGTLCIEPFRVPHDSYDPVGFIISEGKKRVGVVTDLGMPTELVRQRLKNCGIIVLEANHDEDMLRDSTRPWSLKQRIAGRQGHLSNLKAGELLCDVACAELHTVFLAHLSRDCNRPQLATYTVGEALRRRGLSHIRLCMTYPDQASEMARL